MPVTILPHGYQGNCGVKFTGEACGLVRASVMGDDGDINRPDRPHEAFLGRGSRISENHDALSSLASATARAGVSCPARAVHTISVEEDHEGIRVGFLGNATRTRMRAKNPGDGNIIYPQGCSCGYHVHRNGMGIE